MIGALLVFAMLVSISSLYVVEVVPQWMAANERSWAASALASLGELKADIDLAASLGSLAGLSVGVPLSSAGVPVLAAASEGSLDYAPTAEGFAAVAGGFTSAGSPFSTNLSQGTLTLALENRYTAPEKLVLDGDGVLDVPTGGPPVFEYAPALSVALVNGAPTVTATVVATEGLPSATSGPGTAPVAISLVSRSLVPLTGGANGSGTFSLAFSVGSSFACAWAGFFERLTQAAGLTAAAYAIHGPSTACDGVATLELFGVRSASIYLTTIALALDGPT